MLFLQIGGARTVLVSQSLLNSMRYTGTEVSEKLDCELRTIP